MNRRRSAKLWRLLIFCSALALLLGLSVPQEGMTRSQGQMIMAVDFSRAPTFFDPAATSAMGPPYVLLDARHDALIQAALGNALTPGLTVANDPHATDLNARVCVMEGAQPSHDDVCL